MAEISYWEAKSREVIAEVLADHPGATGDELKKLLRPRYPFGERKYWPYKVWLRCVNEAAASQYKPATPENLRNYWVD